MTEEELKTEIERLKKLITALQKRISLIEECQCLSCKQRMMSERQKEEWLRLGD
jgi:hypothetical protein